MTLEDETRLVVIEVAATRDRSGKRMYRAEYPHKAYSAEGRTREEAIGKLMLKTCVPSYLGFRIEER
jgi:hypothetical protein